MSVTWQRRPSQLHRAPAGSGRIIDRQSYFWQDPEGKEHYLGAYARQRGKGHLTRRLADFRRCNGLHAKQEHAT